MSRAHVVCLAGLSLLASCGSGTLAGPDPDPDDAGALPVEDRPGADVVTADARAPSPDVAPTPRDVVAPQGDTPAPGPDAAAPSDPCARASSGDGAYCGASLGAGDANTLYTCVNGRASASVRCAEGCAARPPGVPDACNPAPTMDPCARATLGDGGYCGASLGAGDANTLYTCRGRVTASSTACEYGCGVRPAGTSDVCNAAPASDPCARATSGDGAYCAASLGAGDANTLYTCRGRATASRATCPYGCSARPPGMPDVCAAPPSSGGGGYRLPFACGARVTVTQGNNTSFSHNGTQAWAYDFGVPRGTPVMAAEAGTVRRVSNQVTPGTACWSGGGSECANRVNYVALEHADGSGTLYLHLDAAEVSVGARVSRGQRIGRSGSTGWSTGAHLHLQRQAGCSSWFCTSQSLTFADVGMPRSGATVTSGNCP